MCRVGEGSLFNLSQESLTSPAALQALKRLPETDPTFWKILTEAKPTAPDVKHPDYDGAEDNDPNEMNSALKYEDDQSIPSKVLRDYVIYGDVGQHRCFESEKGDIVPSSISEAIDTNTANNANIEQEDQAAEGSHVPAKRARRANVLYQGSFWEKH